MPNYVPGMGNRDATLMFVGEAPGAAEDYLQEPFVGKTGDLLWEICREIGIDKRELYITNVIKQRPPDNKLKRLSEIGVTIDESINQLWDEINAIRPNCIVAFGNLALKAVAGKGNGFAGIMKWRGSILKSTHLDYKVVPTIHPAALLHSDAELTDDIPHGKKKGPVKYSFRHILKLDLIRAKNESTFKHYDVPQRVIEKARDSVQLGRFLDTYKDKHLVSVDIEVYRSIPFCIGLAFNEWHAVSVPLLDVFSWQNQEGVQEHQLAEMWIQIAELLNNPQMQVIGQNFKFDQRQLARVCGIKIHKLHCDTSLLAHALHPEFPKALDFTTSIYTKEPYYKEEGKEFNWKKDKIDRILNYNGRDACVTFEVYQEMLKDAREIVVPGFTDWVDEFIFGHQMKLHDFYYDLEDVGFKINEDKRKELILLYQKKIDDAQAELNMLAGWEVNVNSKPKCAVLVYNQLKLPQRKGTSEEVLVALMANTKKLGPSARRILELILTIRRLLMTKQKIGSRTDFDGRMRTVYTVCGTETGRSSTKIQKPPVRPFKMGMPFQTLTKHGEIGTEVREMFVADDGYVIVEIDMSQAEARIVALFAQDKYLQAMFAKKADVHRQTAAWIFGVNPEDVTPELRFIGKITRHAGNYDMGKKRLAELVNTEAKRQGISINLSEYKAGIILSKFHSSSPNIREVFHLEVQRCLMENNMVLVNPYGRYRQFYDRWGRELWKEAYAQLPQSTVPDHLRRGGMRAIPRFKKEGVDARLCLEGHDSLVGLVREGHVEQYVHIMKEEIEKPIDFSRCSISRGQLVIPIEVKVGRNYRDFNKRTGENPHGLKELAA